MGRRRCTGAATAALVAGVALAGCAAVKEAVDPETAQLERFSALHAGRDYAAIVDEAVACAPGEAACARLHLLRGDACFALAKRGEAPGEHYACAIEELRAGIDRGRGAGDDDGVAAFEERLLEALRERQDLARSRAGAAPFRAELKRRADAFRAAHPGHPAGYYYGASARLAGVLDGIAAEDAGPDTCRKLDEVLELAEGPAPSGGDATGYGANLARLEADAAGLRDALPGCSP